MQQYLCVYRLERDECWHLEKCHVFHDEGDCGMDAVHMYLSNLMAKMYPQGWSTEHWIGDRVDCVWTTCIGMCIHTNVIPTIIDAEGDVTVHASLNELLKEYW